MIIFAALVAFVTITGWSSFGATPQGARQAMLPVHWALFSLAPHGWTEPVERVLATARCRDVGVALPRPWESFELAAGTPRAR